MEGMRGRDEVYNYPRGRGHLPQFFIHFLKKSMDILFSGKYPVDLSGIRSSYSITVLVNVLTVSAGVVGCYNFPVCCLHRRRIAGVVLIMRLRVSSYRHGHVFPVPGHSSPFATAGRCLPWPLRRCPPSKYFLIRKMDLMLLLDVFLRLTSLLPLLPQVVGPTCHLKSMPVHLWRTFSKVWEIRRILHQQGPLMLDKHLLDILM